MTSTAQRAELQAKIWKIANDVRGSVDGWDFKQFVLGTLFYRFISENFTNYIEGGDEVYAAAQPALSTGGRAILISTPNGMDQLYYKTYMSAKTKEKTAIKNLL